MLHHALDPIISRDALQTSPPPTCCHLHYPRKAFSSPVFNVLLHSFFSATLPSMFLLSLLVPFSPFIHISSEFTPFFSSPTSSFLWNRYCTLPCPFTFHYIFFYEFIASLRLSFLSVLAVAFSNFSFLQYFLFVIFIYLNSCSRHLTPLLVISSSLTTILSIS